MDSYDFVVIGAGTAGCVMAARLSEDAGAKVLLLEAGSGKLPEAVAEPPAWPTLAGTPANWGNTSVVMAATGTSIPLPRGRGLGGSSAINGMVFTRGHRSSYDAWVAAGAKGWGFDDLLPYFRRSEATEGGDPAVRGLDGPLRWHMRDRPIRCRKQVWRQRPSSDTRWPPTSTTVWKKASAGPI